MEGQAPITVRRGGAYQELYEELEADPILGLPSDFMAPKYNFDKPFKVCIGDREAWRRGPPVLGDSMWYTDGSKMEVGVGAGVYGVKPKCSFSVSLGKLATVFQAELAAIRFCATEIEGLRLKSCVIVAFGMASKSEGRTMLQLLQLFAWNLNTSSWVTDAHLHKS
uniref:RNase H type-1 domain-containing protein n=1 Tax=Rhodnius prolixus TaxID=13249 RepID=T1ICQ2_RHOPR